MVKSNKLSATRTPTQAVLTATAQQSRFHAEASEEYTGKEISVEDLNIFIGNREIVSHASLKLQPGVHYVLIGRNGMGKSTLLQAIASSKIPSIPRKLRTLLLGQIQPNSGASSENESYAGETVIDHVIRSDKRRERLLDEQGRLSQAIENTQDPSAVPRAFRSIMHERLKAMITDAGSEADKKSGARGREARKALIKLEEDLEISETRLKAMSLDTELQSLDPTQITEDTNKSYEMLADIQTALDLMNAAAAESKAKSVLLGLGFTAESLGNPISQLSGGWRTRCSLAAALCQSVDLLLLDEPTNFLDLPSIIWLEQYIQEQSDTTMIVVTHDRAFADNIANELFVLRNLQIEHFKGNVSGFEVSRLKTYKYLSRMKDAQEKQKKHMQATIDQNVKSAKRAGDDKKLKQAASRQRKLDERMGMEVSAKGGRFKLSRDLAGHHTNRRAEIELPTFDAPVRITLPNTLADLRFPGALISFENVSFDFHRSGKKIPILRNINLTIQPGDRVGIAGLNGSGKSTLVSLAVARIEQSTDSKWAAMTGTITAHSRARIGVYSQQAVEDLKSIAVGNFSLTALSHLLESTGSDFDEKDARTLLASLGIAGKTVSEVPLALLSGGQMVRLALAKILYAPPHLLVLDEVTTHLDSDTIQALAESLRSYPGALFVITHDRFFMQCVVENVSPRKLALQYSDLEVDDDATDTESEDESEVHREGVVYRLSRTKLTKLSGGMAQYANIAETAVAKLNKA